MTSEYKVTIQGPNLNLVMDAVPKAVCDQIAVLILTGGASQTLSPLGAVSGQGGQTQSQAHFTAPPASTAGVGNPALSLREFLNEIEPKRGPDKITAIGMYMKDHQGNDSFSSAELEKAFESASEPVPGNLSRDIKWTVKTGWIAPKSDAKNRYYVTQSGRIAATKKFPADLVKKTRLSNGSRKGAKKSTAEAS